ncbi:Mannose-binding lectin [Gossypium australe]|uniref:Mannose-binding lectin n=1 Tax=Gossypium australe TaxID=47621 RepID=A0A5B6X685_9ROSI|nr:Mannose-binding lectin [Gossypium australe]
MFANYVDETLQRHVELNDGRIQKFVLHITYCKSELTTHVDQWIDLAIRNNIKELDLAMPLDLHKGYSLPQCVFAARTITALRVNGCKLGPCSDLNLSNLQKLCLGKLRVNEQMIENLIRACPLLEDFRLIYATGSYKIDLSTCNALKSLTLEDATLKDGSFQNHLSCFPALEKLQGFLEKFDYSRGLKLVVRSDKNIVIYERPKGIFLPQVYDLKLDVVKSLVNLEDLLDYILRTWRPLTLSSLSTSRSRLPKVWCPLRLKLVCKKLITREKDPSCCTYNASGNKCWRHFLDNVETENLVNGKSKSE